MSYSQALEEQLRLLRLMQTDEFAEYERSEFVDKLKRGLAKHSLTRDMYDVIRLGLENADPYYWAPQMVHLIEDTSKSLPECRLKIEMLPSPAGFWWFSEVTRAGTSMHGRPAVYRGLGWTPCTTDNSVDGIGFFPVYEWQDNHVRAVGSLIQWDFGRSPEQIVSGTAQAVAHLPVDVREDENAIRVRIQEHKSLLNLFVTGLLFMDQRILVAPGQHVERHTRKRLERDGFTHEPLIRVVELRRKQARSEHHGDSEPVEWSHQWIVSGHWRQQWYPSLNTNQPRWIMPYVKGDPTKPLKPPRAKIFAVIR